MRMLCRASSAGIMFKSMLQMRGGVLDTAQMIYLTCQGIKTKETTGGEVQDLR